MEKGAPEVRVLNELPPRRRHAVIESFELEMAEKVDNELVEFPIDTDGARV